MAGNVIIGGMMEGFRNCSSYLAVIGALSISYIGLKAACSFWSFAKQYLLGLGVNVKSYGSWAVVTGSTDGIGKAYAMELAKRGLNIVLVSRSADKLKAVAKEIEDACHVQTKIIPIDFTGGPEIYGTLAAELANLEVGVLVNNVGMSVNHPQFFAETQSEQELRNIINCNCYSVTFMTKIVLPQMVERKKGIIVNVSSLSGAIPQPLLSVYSATKAYVDFFSRSVHAEYKSKGVIVQCVLPGFVATKLSKIRNASLIAPNPTSFARSAVATIGVATRTPGWWTHSVQLYVSELMPEWLFNRIGMKALLAARKRALAKLQKTQ